MSSAPGVAESLGHYDAYDELYEDWYSHTDNRQMYPHWEKDALKDHVIVKLRRGRNEEPDADSNSNISTNASVDRTPTASRIRVPDSAALSSQSTEEEASNKDINVCRAPSTSSTVITGACGPSSLPSSSQFCAAPSPDYPSLFASFSPPHLPPATHFPSLDARAQLLLERSKETHHRHQQHERHQNRQKEVVVPAFSFSRLQTMVADSGSRERSSVLSHLAGLHNQVQGSPQSPSLWHIPLEGEGIENPDELKSRFRNDNDIDDIEEVESTTVSTKATEDDSEASAGDGWPLRKRLADVRHTFDDSFIPDYRSSTFSGSSVDDKENRRDASPASRQGIGFGPGSECTCGHKKHYVRPLQSQDGASGDDAVSTSGEDGQDFSFYFRSESRQGSSKVRRGSPSDREHNHPHTTEFTDTNIAMEDYAGSERSARTNASPDGSSIFSLAADSRTSSELYLSPNFPDADDRQDYFAGGVVIYSAPDSDGEGRDNTSAMSEVRGRNNDSHRVYFPSQSTQTTESSAPLSTLRRLVTATRRRVSSVGGAALSFTSSGKRQSQSQAQPYTTQPATRRSAPSAKAELERSERRRPRKETNATATTTSSGARKRNVLVKRGRSSTVRPMGVRRSTLHSGPSLPPGNALTESIETKKQVQRGAVQELEAETRRAGGRLSFIRRLSHFTRSSNSHSHSNSIPAPSNSTGRPPTEAHAKPGSKQAKAVEMKPESPASPAQSNASPSSSQVPGDEPTPRARVPRGGLDSGAAALFRHFSLASPRTPRSNHGRA